MAKFFVYLNTIKHLKPVQISWQLLLLFRKRFMWKINIEVPPVRNFYLKQYPDELINENSINIFGETVQPATLNWNNPRRTKLWLYHLHYFDYLANFESQSGLTLIENWIDNHPPGQSPGWEPYPIALRIVNWFKFINKWEIHPNAKIIRSVYTQMIWLYRFRERHLLANHYFKDLVALLYSSCFFNKQKMFNWSIRQIKKQLTEQVRSGLHYEFSPTYHALFTQDLIDIYNFFKSNRFEVAYQSQLENAIRQALTWAEHLSKDQQYIQIGDVNYEGCPKADTLFDVFNFLCKSESRSEDKFQFYYFPVLTDSDFEIMLLNAPFIPDYNPAHSHCDKLSILLWYRNIPIFIDTGNYSYENTFERKYARSVEAHNTVQIDNWQQAEMWDVFRVGNRGKVTNTQVLPDEIQATFCYKKYIHTRTVNRVEKGFKICDKLGCSGRHQYKLYFHLNPDLSYQISENLVQFENYPLEVLLPAGTVSVQKTDYYPAMYSKREKNTIVITGSFEDFITLNTRILR
jgi:hypothetical protein